MLYSLAVSYETKYTHPLWGRDGRGGGAWGSLEGAGLPGSSVGVGMPEAFSWGLLRLLSFVCFYFVATEVSLSNAGFSKAAFLNVDFFTFSFA